MGYIIVWRNSYRDPFISTNGHYFKEEYSSYEDARDAAKDMLDD